jgi:hypothetical protein
VLVPLLLVQQGALVRGASWACHVACQYQSSLVACPPPLLLLLLLLLLTPQGRLHCG